MSFYDPYGQNVPRPTIVTGSVGITNWPNPVTTKIVDSHGDEVNVTMQGQLTTAKLFRMVGSHFDAKAYGVDNRYWVTSSSGTGATRGITDTDGVCTLKSPSSGAGYAQITSFRGARQIFGVPNLCRHLMRLPTVAVSGTLRRWGAYVVSPSSPPNVQDGFAFELDAVGALSLKCYNSGSVVYSANNGQFNGSVSSYTMDTNVHAYEISYYLAKAEFSIDNIVLHRFTPTTVPLASSYHVNCSCVVTGSGTQAQTDLWAATIMRYGEEHTKAKYYHIAGVNAGIQLKIGPGELHQVTINTVGATSIVSLYDGIGAVSPIAIIAPPNGSTPVMLDYDVTFDKGLYVTTANVNTDVTISWE